MIPPLNDPLLIIRLIEILGSVSVIISSLEFIICPKMVNNNSILNWQVFKLRHNLLIHKFWENIFDRLYHPRAYQGLLLARMLAAIMVLMTPLSGMNENIFIHFITITSLLMLLRTTFGMEGSDQFVLVIFISLSIILLDNKILIIKTGILFIAAQLCLAYLTSGYYKIITPDWWNGVSLQGVLNTKNFGNRQLSALLLKNKTLSKLLSRAFILWECTFPLILILPKELKLIFLVFGVLFHFCIALIMGLNNFFWAFLAAYPAILYFNK